MGDEYDKLMRPIEPGPFWNDWAEKKLAAHGITAHPIPGIVSSLAQAIRGTDLSPDQAMANLIDNLKEMHRRETGEKLE
jgi:hypothetical protein